ncbi:MAG: DJ-1/PfpI family protein [Cyanobacteria bacterium]|nr:DJ-1/PfpI family protein [Cyanobacteriota bacterium]
MSDIPNPRTILMVISPNNFRDEELSIPRLRFQEQGWIVEVVSTEPGTFKGMLGAVETVEKSIDSVSPQAYDAVVVVGGMGSLTHLWNHPGLHHCIQAFQHQNKPIAAICLSGAVLAKAGVLKGKNATVWETPESVVALQQGGAHYTGEALTLDGNIVTANGPEVAAAFAQSVVEVVEGLHMASHSSPLTR